MKIECVREKLVAAIARAEKITGKNLSLPVLSCVFLEAKGASLIIRATNLDLGIELSLPTKVEREGVVAVPGSILSSFVSQLQGKNVTLESNEGNLLVSTEANSTVIKCMIHDDFPSIPQVTDGKSFSLNAKDFVKGLKAVWYSSSTSSMKPELSSVYIYPDGESVMFVATDSFRLAEKRVQVKKAKDFQQILIPFKNVPEIIRVLEDSNEEIEIKLNKNQISFSQPSLYLTSRVVDGAFPDYKQIIPKEFKTEAVVLKQDLVAALKLANLFSDAFKQVNFKLDPSAKLFQIKTRNSDVGENSSRVDAALSGEPIEINYNWKYITDCFQSIDSDSIALHFTAHNRPMIMKGISDNSFTYLVMPMNK